MSVKIQECLLNSENKSGLADTTVGTTLKSRNIDHLWSERSAEIDTVVIHFMSDRFRSPDSPYEKEKLLSIFIEYEVSAHYLILRDGEILNLVPETMKAWHAGPSIMPEPDNRTGVNDFSVGIELAGSEIDSFSEEQYRSLNSLLNNVCRRHNIRSITGHEDIAGERAVSLKLRKEKKIDPGPQFIWSKISVKGNLLNNGSHAANR